MLPVGKAASASLWLQELEGGCQCSLLHRGVPAALVHPPTQETGRSGTWMSKCPGDTDFELMDVFLLLLR